MRVRRVCLPVFCVLILTVAAAGQKVPKNVDDAISAVPIWVDWKPGDDLYPRENAKKAMDDGTACISAIDDAIGKGLGASQSLDVNGKKMTLAEAREMCVAVRDKGKKFFGDMVADEEAQYQPFRQVLTGDKLKLYNDRLKKYKLYGLDGKVLKTPEAYAKSDLWCTTGVNRDSIVPVWSVDCWHFKGMAMEGKVTTKTGSGDEAPSAAFR